MTSSPVAPLAITGSTGALGGLVSQALAEAGIPQRLLVRSAARAPQRAHSEVAEFSYSDKAAAVAALSGTTTAFMVSASESPNRLDEHRTFIDALVEAGVQHVVYTSFVGAAPDAVFTLARDHGATEEYLRASGLSFTFLRDNFYLDFLAEIAGADGVIRGPAGEGRVAAVSRADIARTAAAVLANPSAYAGQVLELTGPEALSLAEVATITAEVMGHPITFHNETIDEAYASRAHFGAPAWEVDAWVSTYTAIAAGEQARVSGDVERVTGIRPLSLRELLLARR